MCLFRWRGATVVPLMTVMRDSWRCPRTVVGDGAPGTVLANVPGPSKRTSLWASVFETYSVPVTGFVTMSKSTVPTPAKHDGAAHVAGNDVGWFASIAKTSRSGRE